jgi:hypothetical protein
VVHDVDHCADHQDRRHQDRRRQGHRHQDRHQDEDHQDRQGHLCHQGHQDEDQNLDEDHQGHLCVGHQGRHQYEDHRGHLCVGHQGLCVGHRGHQYEDHQGHQGRDENQDRDGNLHRCDLPVHYLEPHVVQEEEELDDQKETSGQEVAGWDDHLVRLQCEAAYLGGNQMVVDQMVALDAWWVAD